MGFFATCASIAALETPKLNCESHRKFYNDESEVNAAVGEPKEQQLPKLVKDELSAESFLESKIRIAREELLKYLEASKKTYIDKSNEYFHTEREVLSTVSSLHDKREQLFPDALYVLTGGLLGSVFARKRNLLVRILAPFACGLISFRIFFPSTSKNVFGFVDNVEKTNFSSVYEKQTELINKTEDLIKKATELPEDGSKEVTSLFEKAKKLIGDYTGLNVDQSITEKKK